MKKILLILTASFFLLVNGNINAETGSKWKFEYDPVKSKASYLFVIHTEEGYIKDDELTLKNAVPNTLYFSDRPNRIVGYMDTDKFLSGWDEGENSFNKNPPNVVVSFKDGEKYINLTLEISEPVINGKSITFKIENILESDVKLMEGKQRKLKNPSLFIDGGCWIFGC